LTCLIAGVIKAVLDSLDALVYVTDMQTYEILFINQYGKDIWGNIEGKTCWQTIQAGQTGPCSFCTNDKIVTRDGVPTGIHIWEFQNSVNNNWYKCLDQAISWIDGRLVRMELAYDITEQKLLEETVLRERSLIDRIMKTSPAGITVVDRKGQIVFANKRTEDIFCLTKNETTQQGYSAFEWHITDFDGNPFPEEQLPFTQVMNTGNPVYGVHSAIELSDGRRIFLLINGAPIFDEQGHVSEVIMSIDDITKFRQAEEKIQQGLKQLEKSLGDTIKAMSRIVETRDPYTAGHQDKVARLAAAIAEKMNLSEEQIRGIQMAGFIHDIGKMYIPGEILSKPGKLSSIEMQLIKTHSQTGYDIIKDIEFPWPVARIILEHHERMDGSGYPNGVLNNDILPEARIIAVADVVDAMASHRPYRPTLGIGAALGEIEKNRGVLYDSGAVDACLMLFREEGFQLEERRF
jgi:PAS domain S-box-containing protein/putative nucleotidyltransferase with HDIG domain